MEEKFHRTKFLCLQAIKARGYSVSTVGKDEGLWLSVSTSSIRKKRTGELTNRACF